MLRDPGDCVCTGCRAGWKAPERPGTQHTTKARGQALFAKPFHVTHHVFPHGVAITIGVPSCGHPVVTNRLACESPARVRCRWARFEQIQRGGGADLCVRAVGRLSGDNRRDGQRANSDRFGTPFVGRPSEHTLRLGPVTGWRGGGPLCPLRWGFVGRPSTRRAETDLDRFGPTSFRSQAIVRRPPSSNIHRGHVLRGRFRSKRVLCPSGRGLSVGCPLGGHGGPRSRGAGSGPLPRDGWMGADWGFWSQWFVAIGPEMSPDGGLCGPVALGPTGWKPIVRRVARGRDPGE